MRALALTAALLSVPTLAALAAEPSLAVRREQLGNISAAECGDRTRAAFTAAQFRLAERTESIQIAVSGDYVAAAVCVPGQPIQVVISVAGPVSAEASRLADAVRGGLGGQAPAQPQQPRQQPGTK